MAIPGGPRPGNAPPNDNPSSLADGMQNLQINRPTTPPASVANSGNPRPPPPFGQRSPPFHSSAPLSSPFPGATSMTHPGPPLPGALPRSSAPPGGPSLATLPPQLASNRPHDLPPPGTRPPPPFGSRPQLSGSLPYAVNSSGMRPGATFSSSGKVAPPGSHPGPSHTPFGSSPLISGSVLPPSSASGPVSNGAPTSGSGAFQARPRFPSAGSSLPSPRQVGPTPPPPFFARAPPTAPTSRPFLGSPPTGPMPPAAPVPPQGVPPLSGSLPFAPPPQGASPPSGSPYGPQAWPLQPSQVAPPPPISGSAQPPRMFGMPPQPPDQSMATISPAMGHMGASMAGPSKIDPNQIPRPIPSSSVILHETRQGNQANIPPPATSDYIVKDTGNCSPRYMRCTINQIPCTMDLLTTSGMQLALMVQPLAVPHPSEEAIQVIL
ncbi:hypothetical protein U1Q18_044874 [Sarracenia purpurea var. burkii]